MVPENGPDGALHSVSLSGPMWSPMVQWCNGARRCLDVFLRAGDAVLSSSMEHGHVLLCHRRDQLQRRPGHWGALLVSWKLLEIAGNVLQYVLCTCNMTQICIINIYYIMQFIAILINIHIHTYSIYKSEASFGFVVQHQVQEAGDVRAHLHITSMGCIKHPFHGRLKE